MVYPVFAATVAISPTRRGDSCSSVFSNRRAGGRVEGKLDGHSHSELFRRVGGGRVVGLLPVENIPGRTCERTFDLVGPPFGFAHGRSCLLPESSRARLVPAPGLDSDV